MSISYPIDITDKNPKTFTFSPTELGITPVTTNTALLVPTTFDWGGDGSPVYIDGGNQTLNGTPISIWIGKNASLSLLFPDNMGSTYRHEIQSLAFEDGTTDLTANVTWYTVPARNDPPSDWDWQIERGANSETEDPATWSEYTRLYRAARAAYQAARDAYDAAETAYNQAMDDYNDAQSAYDQAWQDYNDAMYEYENWDETSGEPRPEEPQEPTIEEPQEPEYPAILEEGYPDSDDYSYEEWFDSADRETRNFVYSTRTMSDAVGAGNPLVTWVGAGEYGQPICISKSLRLPEGVVNFGQFNFAHSFADKISNVNDQYYHNPTDFRIFLPSTVDHFNIMGDVNEYDDDIPVSTEYEYAWDENRDPSINVLWFGDYANMPGEIWRGNTSWEYPSYPSNAEDFPEFFENTPHDTVHIYLRNHTTVPTINFYGAIYFPIVFHVNGAIKDEFKTRYQGVVRFTENSWSSTSYDYDPISIIVDMGETPEVNTMPLNTTNLNPVVLDGVQSLTNTDLTEAFLGNHFDWYKENDDFINEITPISSNEINYKVYITETSLEDDTTRIIRIMGTAGKETDGETGDWSIQNYTTTLDYVTRDALGNDTVVSSITNDGNWEVSFSGATDEETLTNMYGTYRIDVYYNYPDIELSTELEVTNA